MYNSVHINKLNLENKLSSFKKPYVNFNKEIVIYGAGDMCKMALEFFGIYNIEINTIIVFFEKCYEFTHKIGVALGGRAFCVKACDGITTFRRN